VRTAVLVGLLAMTSPAFAQDADPSDAFEVEVTAERDTWYVRERVTVDVRIQVLDPMYLDTHVVQPFQRELDVPVRLVAPWLEGRDVRAAAPYADTSAVALNDREWGFRKDGIALSTGLVFVASEPEQIDLSTSLEMTVATEFREDFVEGRVAVDPRPVRLGFPGSTLTVLPLPEEGRPAGFSGGVGSFDIGAKLRHPDPERRQVVELTIVVSSSSPDHDITMPVLAELPGFHVVGSREGYVWGGDGPWNQMHHYELEVMDADVKEVPPVPFSYFDPEAAAYRTIHTPALPLPGSVTAPVPPAEPDADASEEPGAGLVPAVVVAVLLVVAGAVLARRRSARRTATAPPDVAAQEARRDLDREDSDPADVLATFLARRLGCEPAAVISPDLSRRLEAAGIASDLAASAAVTLERLVGARYGGAAATDADRDAVRELVDAL
jgi:hypothetical protein